MPTFPRLSGTGLQPILSRRRFLAVAGVALCSVGVVAYWQWQNQAPPADLPVQVVQIGDLQVLVETTGVVQATRSQVIVTQVAADLREVLVSVGASVQVGQLLARLDDTELRKALEQAEIAEQLAELQLARVRHGDATPAQIKAADAAIETAELQLERATTGGATAAEIEQAQANVVLAEAKLAALKNPEPSMVSSAELRLKQAQLDLQSTRDSASQAKTSAWNQMQQSISTLTQAQAAYATATQNWEYVQSSGNDPVNPSTTGANGKSIPNRLNDAQRQQYYTAFVNAEAALRSAEIALEQAKQAYEAARQKEILDVEAAQARLRDAEVQYGTLRHPSAADRIQAEAALTQARAALDKLRAGGTEQERAVAQAELERARAARAELDAPATPLKLKEAELGLRKATLEREAARANLAAAEVKAPFTGIVTQLHAKPGSTLAARSNLLTIADPGQLELTLGVNEFDIQQIQVGQPAIVSFEPLADQQFPGVVATVSPIGEKQGNQTSYTVVVRLESTEQPLKFGMNGDVAITVAERKQVLLVPNQAIQSLGDQQMVLRRKPGTTLFEPLLVEVGISNDTMTEILGCDPQGSCLAAGDELQIIQLPPPGMQSAGGDTTSLSGSGAQPVQILLPAP
ncbi:MAG: efflux RND transporter periplasmic adaptor subunit [Roseiflexaceae bacterium]